MTIPSNPLPISNKSFSFYTKRQYYHELAKRIAATVTGDRVALSTMSFEPDVPEVGIILEELYSAARRGVQVSLNVDAYIFLAGRHATPGPLFFSTRLPRLLPPNLRAKFEALKKLEANGGSCAITNWPSRPLSRPFAGRSHIKLAVVNDYVYLGGCNLNNSDYTDTMLGWDDKHSADWLYGFLCKVVDHQSTESVVRGKDLTYTLDPSTLILTDSGRRHQSLIYEKALELIDEAQESVFIACQYFPNSVTSKHLVRARERGVKVTIIYNHPSKHGFPHSLLQHMVVLRERARVPSSLFKGQLPKNLPFLHAKLIATEKAAIVGSHNYVPSGVNFGTAEIALLRYDRDFSRQAVESLTAQLRTAKPE